MQATEIHEPRDEQQPRAAETATREKTASPIRVNGVKPEQRVAVEAQHEDGQNADAT